MKSRSEVLRSKKSASAKPSAEERTVPLPTELPPDAIVRCKACKETSKAKDCTTREDGFAECPSCGGPCSLEAPAASGPKNPERTYCGECGAKWNLDVGGFEITCEHLTAARVDDPAKAKNAKKNEPSPGVAKLIDEKKAKEEKANALPEGLKPRFCGECGTELAWSPGLKTFFFACGHTKETHGMIDDPREAKKPGSVPAGHQTRTAHETAKRNAEGGGKPAASEFASILATPSGTRLFIPWGKARMPVDRFNSFECGGHSLTIDVPEGEDPNEVAEKAIARLEKIADRLFERQKAWYEKKLGILGAGSE